MINTMSDPSIFFNSFTQFFTCDHYNIIYYNIQYQSQSHKQIIKDI